MQELFYFGYHSSFCLPMASLQHSLILAISSFWHFYLISVIPPFSGVCVCILFVFSLASLDTPSWCFFLVFFLTAHLHLNPCIFRFIGIHFSSNFIYSFQSDFSSIYLQVPNMYVSWAHYFFSSLNSNLPTALFGIFICHTSILIIFSLGQITSFLLSGPSIPTALPSFSIISI